MRLKIKKFTRWLNEGGVDKDIPLKYNKDMDLSQKVKVVWEDILQNGYKNQEWFDEAWDIYEMPDRGKEVYEILKGILSYPDDSTIEALSFMYGDRLIPGYQNGTNQRLTNIFYELAEIFNVENELRRLTGFSTEEEIDELSDAAKDLIINYDQHFGIPNYWQPMEPYNRAADYLTKGKF